jgi:hypothetical protein
MDWQKACDRLNGIHNSKKFGTKFSMLTGQSKKNLNPDIVANGMTCTTEQEQADAFADHIEKTCQTPASSQYSTSHKQRVDDLIQTNHTILNPLPDAPCQTSQPCGPPTHTSPSDNANLGYNIEDPVPKDETEDDISIEEIKQ